MMILILDASPIIAFYSENELNEPELLHTLTEHNYQLVIPQAVFGEIERGQKPTRFKLLEAIKENKIALNTDISEEETKKFRNRHPRLHDGEVQVLLLGLKMDSESKSYWCLIDEGSARKIAMQNNLKLKGSKGLIFLLNDLGIITHEKKENLLNRLNHCNFRS